MTRPAPTHDETPRTPLPAWVAGLAFALAIVLGAFALYTAGVRPLNLFQQRGFHLLVILLIAFLTFPIGRRPRGVVGWAIDGLLLAGALLGGGYLLVNLDAVISRSGFFTSTDVAVGVVMIVVLLEAARRVIGPTIAVIAVVFILYGMAGPRGALPWLGDFLPGILAHRGYGAERIVGQLYLGQEGIFGLPLGVAATVVFTFVLFGAFLETTGAGRFFIDLAYAVAGRQRGGPAKAAVVASGFMGSVSGSAIANVVTSGAFTIPLMKRLGYTREEAGGVEAAASTGGQIMPPIMGAGAFLMAEYTGLPYADIVRLSVLPAFLYFATVYLFVDVIAAKRGMRGLSSAELPKLREVFADGWYYLVPLGVLIYFLLANVSPNRVGFVAIVSIVAVSALRWAIRRSWLRHHPGVSVLSFGEALRRGSTDLLLAFGNAARNAVPVSIACAVAGVVVGMITLTGIGLKFSSLMMAFSGGNLLLALLLLAVASLVLGLGLPVTASYIVLAVLAAPLLQSEFGIPILIAHLVIFWYSQDSNVTPPVALAAFAGAAIAQGNPMRTAVQAWKFAKGLYLIPLFMIYNPEIVIGGEPWYVAWTIASAMVALFAFAAALEGFMFTWMIWPNRVLAGVGLVLIFQPDFALEVVGVAVMLAVLAVNWTRHRRMKTASA